MYKGLKKKLSLDYNLRNDSVKPDKNIVALIKYSIVDLQTKFGILEMPRSKVYICTTCLRGCGTPALLPKRVYKEFSKWCDGKNPNELTRSFIKCTDEVCWKIDSRPKVVVPNLLRNFGSVVSFTIRYCDSRIMLVRKSEDPQEEMVVDTECGGNPIENGVKENTQSSKNDICERFTELGASDRKTFEEETRRIFDQQFMDRVSAGNAVEEIIQTDFELGERNFEMVWVTPGGIDIAETLVSRAFYDMYTKLPLVDQQVFQVVLCLLGFDLPIHRWTEIINREDQRDMKELLKNRRLENLNIDWIHCGIITGVMKDDGKIL